MYLNADGNSWKAAMFEVIDLDTGKIIPHVLWADDEIGIYGQYQFDENEEIILDCLGEPFVKIKYGNIKLREI